MTRFKSLLATVPLALATLAGQAAANDTTFTYQGSLKDGGAPADGPHTMTFRLYSAASGGSPLGTINAGSVNVQDGLFSVELDFGPSSWNNTDRWLEIVVDGSTLSPRQPVNRSPYAITTRGLSVNSNGQVGIGGAATTTNMLTIRDEDAYLLLLSQGNNFGPRLTMRNTASSIAGTIHGNIIFDDGAQLASIGYIKSGFVPNGLQFSGASSVNMKITDTGLVGMGGELDPATILHVQRDDIGLDATHFAEVDLAVEDQDAIIGAFSNGIGTRGSGINLGEVNGGAFVDTWGIGRNTSGAGSSLFFKYGSSTNISSNPTMMVLDTDGDVYIPAGGRLGVGTSDPDTALHVIGNARVNVLEVTGADLAERFPTVDDAPMAPGMVVEIDPDNVGHLRLAQGEYSPLVAGIVSGANGLPAGTVMGNLPGAEDGPAIALSGRVWVYCDAAEHAIEPGALLTTSPTPGHAMRAADPDRAHGAVIGKAMSSLGKGETGLVLVIVGLQ